MCKLNRSKEVEVVLPSETYMRVDFMYKENVYTQVYK